MDISLIGVVGALVMYGVSVSPSLLARSCPCVRLIPAGLFRMLPGYGRAAVALGDVPQARRPRGASGARDFSLPGEPS